VTPLTPLGWDPGWGPKGTRGVPGVPKGPRGRDPPVPPTTPGPPGNQEVIPNDNGRESQELGTSLEVSWKSLSLTQPVDRPHL
jgi:hypothetical protein